MNNIGSVKNLGVMKKIRTFVIQEMMYTYTEVKRQETCNARNVPENSLQAGGKKIDMNRKYPILRL